MTTLAIFNGPNLNLLGRREPGIYGSLSLEAIANQCREAAAPVTIDFRQTNCEAEMIGWIQTTEAAALILNAAAWTHTSLAIADAVRMFVGPKIEVHLSNIYARETFRHHSYLSAVVDGGMFGFGADVYPQAIRAAKNMLEVRPQHKA